MEYNMTICSNEKLKNIHNILIDGYDTWMTSSELMDFLLDGNEVIQIKIII